MKYQVKFSNMEEILEFVKIASKLPEDIDIVEGNITIDAKSILGLLSCCRFGENMLLKIHGKQPEDMAKRIQNFIVAEA